MISIDKEFLRIYVWLEQQVVINLLFVSVRFKFNLLVLPAHEDYKINVTKSTQMHA